MSTLKEAVEAKLESADKSEILTILLDMADTLKFYAWKANDFTTIEEDEYHFDVDAGEKAQQGLERLRKWSEG